MTRLSASLLLAWLAGLMAAFVGLLGLMAILLAAGAVRAESGIASFYTYGPTACGDKGLPAMTAAHKSLPCNTVVKVTRTSGQSVVVRIRDRGPFIAGRIIDLDPEAAKVLGIVHSGLAQVRLEVLAGVTPTPVKTISYKRPAAKAKPRKRWKRKRGRR